MATTPRLRSLPGGAQPEDRLHDIKAVTEDHLAPALRGLRKAAEDGDLLAVRAYALELSLGAATVASACPRPRPGGRFEPSA